MKTSGELLRDVCSEVMGDMFPYDRMSDRKADAKVVDDQLYELSKLALELQKVVLEARANGATDSALWQALWEIVR